MKRFSMVVAVALWPAAVLARDDSPHREEALRAAARVAQEASRQARETRNDPFARKIVDHFNPITDHRDNPPPARVHRGTALRDSLGNPLYDHDEQGQRQPITIGREPGEENIPLTVQRRPILKDRKGNRLFYVRGTTGKFYVGGRPARGNAAYSGCIRAEDFYRSDLARLETGTHPIDSVAAPWGDWLKSGNPQRADRKPYYIGTYYVAPEPVVGIDIGKSGNARH